MLDIEKIKRLRERLKLSQAEAAERAGIGTRQSWNKIESGREGNLSLERLEKIAAALGVKSKDLLK